VVSEGDAPGATEGEGASGFATDELADGCGAVGGEPADVVEHPARASVNPIAAGRDLRMMPPFASGDGAGGARVATDAEDGRPSGSRCR